MKLIEILVHHQADEQVVLGLALVFRRQLGHGLVQDRVGGTVANVADQILFDAGQCPSLANGRAALRNDAGQRDLAAHGHRHPAVLEHLAIEIDLRERFGQIAGGQPAISGTDA